MLCSISSTVLPCSTSRRTIGTILAIDSVSSPEVGSSSNRTSALGGEDARHRQQLLLRIGEILGELAARAPASPKNSSTSMARSRARSFLGAHAPGAQEQA